MNIPMRVLFVCVHNAGRSQMAEALYNHIAREQGLETSAESAGTLAGSSLNPAAVEAMAEIGVSMEGHHPKLLTQDMVDRADRIISMGCGVDTESCPAKFFLTEDWELDDPAGQDIEKVREIRDRIESKVRKLLVEISGKTGTA